MDENEPQSTNPVRNQDCDRSPGLPLGASRALYGLRGNQLEAAEGGGGTFAASLYQRSVDQLCGTNEDLIIEAVGMRRGRLDMIEALIHILDKTR